MTLWMDARLRESKNKSILTLHWTNPFQHEKIKKIKLKA